MSIVIDASALVALLTGDKGADRVETALLHEGSFAPELIDVEVANAFRRLEAAGLLSATAAGRAISAAADAPIIRQRHRPLIRGAWDLRANLSIYDAMYVALAARLRCPLMTKDRRLAMVPGLGVSVHLLPP